MILEIGCTSAKLTVRGLGVEGLRDSSADVSRLRKLQSALNFKDHRFLVRWDIPVYVRLAK